MMMSCFALMVSEPCSCFMGLETINIAFLFLDRWYRFLVYSRMRTIGLFSGRSLVGSLVNTDLYCCFNSSALFKLSVARLAIK